MAGTVSLWRRESMFLTAMLEVEISVVGVNTLFKVATSKGLNLYAFLGYSYLLASLLLLPSLFFSNRFLITLREIPSNTTKKVFFPKIPLFVHRSRSLPPLSFSILCKTGLLGFLGSMNVFAGYVGIEYSSPTLSSAISNITPALTFILAVVFRMEKVSFKERSSVAKVMGTILSLIGALVVVLYHGPRVFVASSPPYLNVRQLSPPLSSSNSDWLIGGALLTLQGIFVSVTFVLQAHIMSVYPAAFRVSFLYTIWVSIVTSTIGLIVQRKNPSVWIIHFDITLITIVTMAIVISEYYVIHSWTVRHKGPLYLAIFKPLSILIAVIMGMIFLNDSLYLGCLIGGILITLGFYAVMWGKANEDKDKLLSFSEKEQTLLLSKSNTDII